jgi:transcriptional regulator GlxA family with amidase domain
VLCICSGSLLAARAGITAGIDLALHMLAELSGPRIALDIARMMVVYLRREAEDPQLSPWLAYRNHDTWVHENDRGGLERLANYGARGPLSLERLSQLCRPNERRLRPRSCRFPPAAPCALAAARLPRL